MFFSQKKPGSTTWSAPETSIVNETKEGGTGGTTKPKEEDDEEKDKEMFVRSISSPGRRRK